MCLNCLSLCMKTRVLYIILFSACSTMFCMCGSPGKKTDKVVINEDSVKLVIHNLDKGFKEKDYNILQANFADNFSISVATASKNYIDPILSSNGIQSINFVSVDSVYNDSIFTVKTLINGVKGETESIIAFNKNYKVLFIDYMDRLYGHSRYNKSEKKAVFPFELKNGHILISLKLNDSDKVLKFLLDTGADGMAIRKTLADSLNLPLSHSQNANIVGGQMQITISSGNTVHLTDDFSLKNQNIALFETVKDSDGIIGLNLATNYITNVDFDKNEITLSTFGDYKYSGEGEIIPVTVPYGIILIPGTLNIVGKEDVEGNFVFDSGANYYLIAFNQFVRKNRLLLSGFKPEDQASTISMGHATPVFLGKAYKFRFAPNIEFTNMPITLQASTGEGENNRRVPDGSIGIELIQKFNFTIDLLKKEIFLSSRV